MGQVRFDRLHTVRLEHESRNGCAELCLEPDGTRWIRLRIASPACQRELLNALDEGIPVRIADGALELLLPWREGVPVRQWLFERTPTLGQRRDACLDLLGQLVELRRSLPPCLTALAASMENLTASGGSLSLQYLPALRHWEPGMGEGQAVCAVAAVICEVLAPGQGGWPRGRLPEELQLLYRRQEGRDYTSWGQLQRDVAAVPDELPRIRPFWAPWGRRVRGWLSRYGKYILRTLAAVLLAVALLSLALACRQWLRERGDGVVWPGMPQVGNQDLRSGEGGE